MRLPQVSFRVMLLLWACWGVLICLLFLPRDRFGYQINYGWGPFHYLTGPRYAPPHPWEHDYALHHPGLELVLLIGSGVTIVAIVGFLGWLRSLPAPKREIAITQGLIAFGVFIILLVILQLFEQEPSPTYCHPGCFPAGSLIMTPTGSAPVESFQVGDKISTFEPSGATTVEEIEVVFSTCTALLWVDTVEGSLATTPLQPLVLAGGQLRAAGELQPGDLLLRCHEGRIVETRVLGTRQSNDNRQVYNLVIKGQDPRPFVANGFLARSKPPAPR